MIEELKSYRKMLYLAAERLDLYKERDKLLKIESPDTLMQVELRRLGDLIVEKGITPIIIPYFPLPMLIVGFVLGFVLAALFI